MAFGSIPRFVIQYGTSERDRAFAVVFQRFLTPKGARIGRLGLHLWNRVYGYNRRWYRKAYREAMGR